MANTVTTRTKETITVSASHDLVMVRWWDVLQLSDWTPSSDPETDCPEILSVGFLMADDSDEYQLKLATTIDKDGIGSGVISFPKGVIKEIINCGQTDD